MRSLNLYKLLTLSWGSSSMETWPNQLVQHGDYYTLELSSLFDRLNAFTSEFSRCTSKIFANHQGILQKASNQVNSSSAYCYIDEAIQQSQQYY